MGIYACAMHELTTLSLQASYHDIIDALESFHPDLDINFHFLEIFSLIKLMNYRLGFPYLEINCAKSFSRGALLI
jgi:hypothetical protein